MLRKTDIAVIVTDTSEKDEETERFIEKVKDKGIPFILVRNKYDLVEADAEGNDVLFVSAKTGKNINELKMRIAASIPAVRAEKRIVSDLLKKGDTVILVTPIDESAPKGRLILPQQQTIRDILNIGGICMVAQPDELASSLDLLKEQPRMIVCDSQVFGYVDSVVPKDIALTSFSILFARYRGNFEQLIRGSDAIDRLKDGDTVLISEGCTHHRQCEDIGTVKLPRWISRYTGKELRFAYSSGNSFPDDLRPYRLVVHCGACMLPPRALQSRLRQAVLQGVPHDEFRNPHRADEGDFAAQFGSVPLPVRPPAEFGLYTPRILHYNAIIINRREAMGEVALSQPALAAVMKMQQNERTESEIYRRIAACTKNRSATARCCSG